MVKIMKKRSGVVPHCCHGHIRWSLKEKEPRKVGSGSPEWWILNDTIHINTMGVYTGAGKKCLLGTKMLRTAKLVDYCSLLACTSRHVSMCKLKVTSYYGENIIASPCFLLYHSLYVCTDTLRYVLDILIQHLNLLLWNTTSPTLRCKGAV